MNSSGTFIDLSIIIITFNEEKHLGACLGSLPCGAELIVLDSLSSDGTEKIARDFGAAFHTRAFTNYGEQKNAALSYASRRWVLSLDADEVLSPALSSRIQAIVAEKASLPFQGYRLHRRLRFLGKDLRFGHTSDYPLRLFRRTLGTFVNPLHERVEIAGPIARLHETLLHNSYDDLADYFAKFNRYTSHAARAASPVVRSPSAFLHLALRPLVTFLHRYIVRLGFLDGYPGYCYALLSSFYVFTKYAKLRELRK
jgi:glycosyltransferase involved in cell wall biosynthesis